MDKFYAIIQMKTENEKWCAGKEITGKRGFRYCWADWNNRAVWSDRARARAALRSIRDYSRWSGIHCDAVLELHTDPARITVEAIEGAARNGGRRLRVLLDGEEKAVVVGSPNIATSYQLTQEIIKIATGSVLPVRTVAK